MKSYTSEALQVIPNIITQEDQERLMRTNELSVNVTLCEELLDKYPEGAHPYLLIRMANLLLLFGGDAIAVNLYRKAQGVMARLNIVDEEFDVFLHVTAERTESQANTALEKSNQVTFFQPWRPTKDYVFPTNQPLLPIGARELQYWWSELNKDPAFYPCYLIKLAIETNHVENTFLLEDKSAQDLIKRGLDEGEVKARPHSMLSRPEKIRSILKDAVAAYHEMAPLVTNTLPLSMPQACAIHATLTKTCRFTKSRYVAPGITRTQTRKTVLVSGSYNVQMCPYPWVDKEFEYVCRMAKQWIRTWRNPFGSASWTHLALVSCHPFDDGNGRLVRIVASLPLLQHGYPPISVTLAQKTDYNVAIRKARDGDHSLMLQCIMEGMKETIATVEKLRAQ